MGWSNFLLSTDNTCRIEDETIQTSKFCVLSNNNLADVIWDKVKFFLPDNLAFMEENDSFNSVTGEEWEPVSIYNKFSVYKYEEGDAFSYNSDLQLKRNIFKDKDEYNERTFFMLCIYLNDCFEGGETVYRHNSTNGNFISNSDTHSTIKDNIITI